MGVFDLRHGLAVASRVDGYEQKLVAILHDAIEDEACEYNELEDAGLSLHVVYAVEILTRWNPDESYQTYIDRIANSGNTIAITVKLADLATNIERMDEAHQSLLERYVKATTQLEAALKKGEPG